MIDRLKYLMKLSKEQGYYKPIRSRRGGFSFIYWDGSSKVGYSKNFSLICTDCLKDENEDLRALMLEGYFKCQKGAFNRGATGCGCSERRRKLNLMKVGIYEGVGECIENGFGGIAKFVSLDKTSMEYIMECSVCSKHTIMGEDKYFRVPYFSSYAKPSHYCFCKTIKNLPSDLKNKYVRHSAVDKGVEVIDADFSHYNLKDCVLSLKCITCGTEWNSVYPVFYRNKKGCPVCWRSSSENIRGFYPQYLSREDTLYIVRFYDTIEDFYFIKVGRTFDFSRRYVKSGRYSYEVVLLYKSVHSTIYDLETRLLKETSKYFLKLGDTEFKGRFECRKDSCRFFIKNIFKKLDTEFRDIKSAAHWFSEEKGDPLIYRVSWEQVYGKHSWDKEVLTYEHYLKRFEKLRSNKNI